MSYFLSGNIKPRKTGKRSTGILIGGNLTPKKQGRETRSSGMLIGGYTEPRKQEHREKQLSPLQRERSSFLARRMGLKRRLAERQEQLKLRQQQQELREQEIEFERQEKDYREQHPTELQRLGEKFKSWRKKKYAKKLSKEKYVSMAELKGLEKIKEKRKN